MTDSPWPLSLQQQQRDIELLLQTDGYPTELFSQLWQSYQASLEAFCHEIQDPALLQSVLADNLQWVTLIIQHVTSEKDAVAAKLLQLQRGKRAQQSYGDNN